MGFSLFFAGGRSGGFGGLRLCLAACSALSCLEGLERGKVFVRGAVRCDGVRFSAVKTVEIGTAGHEQVVLLGIVEERLRLFLGVLGGPDFDAVEAHLNEFVEDFEDAGTARVRDDGDAARFVDGIDDFLRLRILRLDEDVVLALRVEEFVM